MFVLGTKVPLLWGEAHAKMASLPRDMDAVFQLCEVHKWSEYHFAAASSLCSHCRCEHWSSSNVNTTFRCSSSTARLL